MPKQQKIPTVLASWWVDAATWRTYVRAVEAAARRTTFVGQFRKLNEIPPTPAGVEVIIRTDELRAGPHSFPLGSYAPDAELLPDWLEFRVGWDEGVGVIPLPVSPIARDEAARIAERFASDLAARERAAVEERAAPTLNNRVLNVVERHFIVLMLVLFFAILPAVIGLLYLASKRYGWGTR